MAESSFDRNLKRLLRIAGSVEPSPRFRDRLRRSLQEEAARIRVKPVSLEAEPFVVRTPASSGPSRVHVWRRVAAGVLLAFTVSASVWVLRDDAPRDSDRTVSKADENKPPPLRLSPQKPLVVEVPRGSRGGVSLDDGFGEVARLDLSDGASVEIAPGGGRPLLALSDGLVHVTSRRGLTLRAFTVELAMSSGAEVEVEVITRGDRSMNKSWLIPGGLGVAAGAAVVAILVHRGDVEVKVPESRPAAVPVERPLLVEVPTTRPAADDDRLLASAERRIAELEKKLAAAKKENEKLAAELVQKKGVTIDNVVARIQDLRKASGLSAFLPGKTAELIADLKGLGPEGVQALLDLLKSEDPKDRFLAGKLLEDLKDPSAIPALRETALNDADAMASNMASHALALMEDPRAVEALRELVGKNRSWESSVNALWGLVNLGDAQGLEQAIAYMNDRNNTAGARAALGANIGVFIHTPEVMPIVDQTVKDFYESAQVMGIAVDYYKALGTPDARDRLRAIANDTRVEASIRDAARQALQ